MLDWGLSNCARYVLGQNFGQSSSGGLNINGIIKQYKVAAGNNINAGDFATFVNQRFF